MSDDEQTNGEAPTATEPYPWEGERQSFAELMLQRGRAYASKVNLERSLPSILDGCKISQRRVLFSILKTPARANSKPVKSARIIGFCIGFVHPHGDASVLDTMARLAQPFTMSIPLVDGHGNWGTVDGDPPAAARYTEARLAEVSDAWMVDLHPEIVPFRKTFDESSMEPEVLPVTFPNLLVNGSSGIGWAMACEIPTHNLAEVVDAALVVCEAPDAPLPRILRRMPGPDFPGGGIIVDPSPLEKIYETGHGSITVQSRYVIEQIDRGQQVITFSELPPGVRPNAVIKMIVERAREEKLTEIATNELPRNITEGSTARVQVKTKRGGDVQLLLQQLLTHTPLRSNVQFNFTVVAEDGYPRRVTLREMLLAFVDFRQVIIRARLERERREEHRELHRLLGLIAASDVIDKVVKAIREADSDEDAKRRLIALPLKYPPHGARKHVPIDDQQAQWIIDMRLKRINQLNQLNLREQAERHARRIGEITQILDSEDGVKDILKSELRDVRRRFGIPRRTQMSEPGAVQVVDGRKQFEVVSGPSQEVTAWVASNGAAVMQVRGKSHQASPLRLSGAAELVGVMPTMSDGALMCLSARGTAFRMPLADVPVVSKQSTGATPILLAKGDRLVGVFVESAELPYLLMVTRQGQLKRISIGEVLGSAHTNGGPAFGVPDGDEIVAVVPHAEGDHVIIATACGQALRVDTSANMRPVKTGSAGGVAAINLKGSDRVVGACRVEASAETLLTVHSSGMGKRVQLDDYPVKGRATGGVQSSFTDKPTRSPAGEVTMVACVPAKADLEIVTRRGSVLSLDYQRIPVVGRAVVPKAAFDLGPGDAPLAVRGAQ